MADESQTKATSSSDEVESRFFTLPPELRVRVYEYVFSTVVLKKKKKKGKRRLPHALDSIQTLRKMLSLLRVCQIIRKEALPVYDARLGQFTRDAVTEEREDYQGMYAKLAKAFDNKIPESALQDLEHEKIRLSLCLTGFFSQVVQMRDRVGK